MHPAHEGVRRLSVAHFLIALVLWLVCAPFLDQFPYGDLIEAGLITVVFMLAVTAVGGRRRTHAMAAVLVAPALVAKWIGHFRPDALSKEFVLAAAIVFASFVIAHLLIFILRAPCVNAEVLCAAVATFLMLGLLGAFAFELVARLVPNSFVFTIGSDSNRSFTTIDALYFSFGALTSFAGDIIPVSRVARTLVMVQTTVGVFYLALLVARLVGVYSTGQPSKPTTNP